MKYIYQVLAGQHTENGKDYGKGAEVKTHYKLDEVYGKNKFKLVRELETEPPADSNVSKSEAVDYSDFEDVTSEFPTAQAVGFTVKHSTSPKRYAVFNDEGELVESEDPITTKKAVRELLENS